MGKPSAPRPPDPVATANAQSAANAEAIREGAAISQINQVTPFGSLTYQGEIGTPDRTVIQQLNPQSQNILDRQRQLGINLSQQASSALSSPYSIDSRFSLPNASPLSRFADSGNMSDYNERNPATELNRQRIERAYFDRAKNLLEPEFARQRTSEETKLVNQGIPRGSEAFDDRYYDQLVDSQNRTLSDAALAAVRAGGDEYARQEGINQSKRQQDFNIATAGRQQDFDIARLAAQQDFDTAQRGRQQDINESLMVRNQPINELAAVLTGNQAISTPNFISTPNYQPAAPDISGMMASNFNNANANYQANIGGLYGLGGALAGAIPLGFALSDRRLKKDIKPLMKGRYQWYTYSYIWSDDTYVGVMADEVLAISPKAVNDNGAYMAVDYGVL